jgi:hypothetical protein
MKFTTNFKFIAIIALITLSCISAAKISAKNKDGSGNWDNGFTCPKILVNDKNQGEATIYAKLITEQSGDNVYSMLFAFKSAPGAEFKKIARDAGGNKWRVSYRRMGNNFGYTNPWGNKYIQGDLNDETGKKFNMKIILPYKTFGWYINDDQGNKITNAMNKSAVIRSNIVENNKYNVRKQFANYKAYKGQFDAISKNKADYEKFVEGQKKQLISLMKSIDNLRTKASESQDAVDDKNRDLIRAHYELNKLLNLESELASKKTAIVESIEKFSKIKDDNDAWKKELTKDVAAVKKVLDAEFEALNKNIEPKVAEANNAKRDLYAMKKTEYNQHMSKIYP